VIGREIRGPLQEQFGNAAGSFGAPLGIAIPDDLIEPRNQRSGISDFATVVNRTQNPGALPGFGGNFGRVRESRVRF
jgi:hypothetical protein